jgi:hypothetical protein
MSGGGAAGEPPFGEVGRVLLSSTLIGHERGLQATLEHLRPFCARAPAAAAATPVAAHDAARPLTRRHAERERAALTGRRAAGGASLQAAATEATVAAAAGTSLSSASSPAATAAVTTACAPATAAAAAAAAAAAGTTTTSKAAQANSPSSPTPRSAHALAAGAGVGASSARSPAAQGQEKEPTGEAEADEPELDASALRAAVQRETQDFLLLAGDNGALLATKLAQLRKHNHYLRRRVASGNPAASGLMSATARATSLATARAARRWRTPTTCGYDSDSTATSCTATTEESSWASGERGKEIYQRSLRAGRVLPRPAPAAAASALAPAAAELSHEELLTQARTLINLLSAAPGRAPSESLHSMALALLQMTKAR